MLPIALLFGFVAALANLVGGLAITAKPRWDETFLKYFTAVGSGFMLGAALLHLVPESIERTRTAPLWMLAGYLLIHFAEHTLAPHFHFGEEVHHEAGLLPASGLVAVGGLTIHTFFDGVSIMSGFEVGNRLGLLIFLAVFLHKLPEGFTVSSIMLAAGRSRAAARGAAAVVGAATLAGVLVAGLFAAGFFEKVLGARLAISAGVLLYVAATDLIPEVNRERGIWLGLMVFVGILCFYLTETLLHLFGI
ncbi:MAG TPA: ZIP family metal transporter [Candidatus Sulfotelmatobacter sp.]|nr:ZIP family metal transporter [Candidatus Sulfotelmatobacter sp.]